MPEDSLTKRFTFKLGSNLVGLIVGLISIGMVPRALGPSNYGVFGFLTFFFARVVQFLKLGTSAAYFTKISTRPKEKELIGFYVYFISWLIIMVFVGIAGVFVIDLNNLVWPEQELKYIIAAAIFATLTFISNFIHDTNDAFGHTVINEVFYVIKSILGTGLVLILYFTGRLTLTSYFLIHYLQLIFIILAGTKILYSFRVSVFSYWKSAWKKVRHYGAEFYTYSQPLFFNGLVVFLVEIGDRWLLQYFGGSVQQGYYSFALKLGAICFLFTSSMVPLFTRELSQSYGDKDIGRMRELFDRIIPSFFSIATYFAVFISVNSKEIILLLGGEQYIGASGIVSILAFYPIYQTYGQLNGSLLLATAKSKQIRNIGVSTALFGIIGSYFLLVPANMGGLDLGAIGLAIKIIIISAISVNIQLWLNSKILNISFLKYFTHQIFIPLIFLALAICSNLIIRQLFDSGFINILINGVAYTSAIFLLVYLHPKLFGISRSQILSIRNQYIKSR